MSRRLLHLVRAAHPDAGAVDLLHDWVVERAEGSPGGSATGSRGAWHLLDHGPPPPAPLEPGPLDDDALVQLLLAADLVAVW